MYALERGIEAAFQLEDSELDSELLPGRTRDRRSRMLLIESAEGGAGVLRRLQAEPARLARAAPMALEIAHFDPERRRPRRPADPAAPDTSARRAATTACSVTATRPSTS